MTPWAEPDPGEAPTGKIIVVRYGLYYYTAKKLCKYTYKGFWQYQA